MKFFVNVGLIIFLTLAAYLLLNENNRARKPVTISGSTSKLIGIRTNHELMPFELQQMRINSETIYRFQSTKSGESYELHESDLDKFDAKLIDFKNINRDYVRPANMIKDNLKRF